MIAADDADGLSSRGEGRPVAAGLCGDRSVAPGNTANQRQNNSLHGHPQFVSRSCASCSPNARQNPGKTWEPKGIQYLSSISLDSWLSTLMPRDVKRALFLAVIGVALFNAGRLVRLVLIGQGS